MRLRTVTLAPGQRLTEQLLDRRGGISPEVVQIAAQIIEDVRREGDDTIRCLTEQFDHVSPETVGPLEVSEAEFEEAFSSLDDEVVRALERAATRIEDFHRRQVTQSWFTTKADGTLLGMQVTPLERVGIYVPGGRAQYPSSVLMNALPARCAGVDEIVMCAPPGRDGRVAAVTLVAAKVAGVDRVFKVGGAQAIAALAYGTHTIPAVDKITGPGNAYVAAAKKLVNGDVGIDLIAGPSEVLVLADDTAQPRLIAIDLMAQAEHDPRAAVYLVCTDDTLPARVDAQLESLLAETSREEVTRAALEENSVALVCATRADAIAAANVIAPEHLEVLMKDPLAVLGSIRNAGAVFLGPWTPEAVGDYIAGPNHVLPTGSTARFSSPLSVDDFVTKTSVLSYTPAALLDDATTVETLAKCEGLWAHGMSVTLRRESALDAEGREAE